MNQDHVVERLTAALGAPLPGPGAHLRMVVGERLGWVPGHVPEDARPAGVLVLLYPDNGETHLPLTVRTHAVETHRGQVSLPGGALDPGEDPERGAIREGEEEVGIPGEKVRVLGRLSPLYIPVSGFVAHPVVGALDHRPSFAPSPSEVAELIEAPLAELAAPGAVHKDRFEFERGPRTVAYFPVAGHRVWGATAMILAELLTLLDARSWE